MLRHHLVLIGGLATVALVSSTDAGAQSTAQSIQSGAAAQTTGFQIPQSDVNCDWSTIPGGFGSPRLGTVPPCTTSGTRQVTTVQQSFLFFPPSFFVETSGVYNVSFSGTLQTDGRPGTASTPDFLGLANLQTDVNVTTSYTGKAVQPFPSSPNPLAYFQEYSNFQTQVNSINTSASGVRIPDATTGQTYYYDFTTLNPTAISSSNSVTLVGRYRSAEGNNRIEFGTLSGSATLVGGGITTSDPSNPSAQYFSPFALAYSFTPTVTTTLDETGLVTPKVSVTDGINMNGSKITNLAPGTDPGDAVNRAQMDAEADARIAADALLTQQYNEVAASGAAETSQRIAADNALGARLSVVEGSLATVDARLGKLDQQIASSTAIATAMSGNAFLPDMKFNLTGNLATYDGAYAGSLQMGAMVSRRAAINAGIAKGFNKNGKTAARVGLTVGW